MSSSMVDKLLEQLRHRGLEVRYQDDNTLILVGPKEEKKDDVLKTVKAFKADLIEHLRPRDTSLWRDVHHPPSAPGPADEPSNIRRDVAVCQKCKSHVWDAEETGMVCDDLACPFKGAV